MPNSPPSPASRSRSPLAPLPAGSARSRRSPAPSRGERPERKGRKGRETAERILDVAEEIFAEKGYEGATLRDVASRVGIRTPSLYNHFDGKDSLYAAVLERGIGPVLRALGESAAAGGPSHDPGRLVERMMELLAKRPQLPRLVVHETLSGGRHLTRILQQWLGPTLQQAQQMVETGPAARRWETEQLPNLVLAMYHIVVGYFAIAPLYRELNGVDLLSAEALEHQTRFLRKLATSLFAEDPDFAESPAAGSD
jgi:TetR/AcrR family transcriptional regulator